ncbi:MAG: hypothetical protein COV67_09030 [Nitrospinae bacterium CG11_big_fil_rev_8_21_14_0_20_56_8]|nr:MAG: hypothetical protein COV67_09030 [Nitrospinae bacterium CG11_big_fil_rev_8_21_14_0_20_56_8]
MDTEDPEWNVKHHPAKEILRKFPPGFGRWVRGLYQLRLLRQGGMPGDKNDLDPLGWKALALIGCYEESKRWEHRGRFGTSGERFEGCRSPRIG